MKRVPGILVLLALLGLNRAVCAVESAAPAASNQIAVITGYHGYNAPLLLDALKPRGVKIDRINGWLPLSRYPEFGAVILDGWLERASIQPAQFAAPDLDLLEQYLNAGGTFIFMRQAWRSFDTPAGKAFLARHMGGPVGGKGGPRLALDHPWLAHLPADAKPAWLTAGAGDALPYSRGTSVIDLAPGRTILHHMRVGAGQLIYWGWDVFRFRPPGRTKTTPEQEQSYNQQTAILERLALDLYPTTAAPLPARVFFDAPYELPAQQVRPLPPLPTEGFLSYPPTRPLPTPSDRPLASGAARYVDGQRGSDDADGSEAQPWRTLGHAVAQLEPGQTLYLRGGTYFENVTLQRSGTPDQPITLRSYPGELVILDGGLRQLVEDPANAWEPLPENAGGAPGEFQSTATYPGLGSNPNEPNLLGRFGDSLIPLQGYRFLADLRSDNHYWNVRNNATDETTMYCGPGVWYNPQTQRIHCRLAHTQLPGLGADNYRGTTDPRQVPLIIGSRTPTLSLVNVRHVVLQDLVLRGSGGPTLKLSVAGDIVLDGLTVYGGSTCLHGEYVHSLRAIHCAFRGIAAPWTFRSNLKYRSLESELVIFTSWRPTDNHDVELAYCEFTDSIDGVFLGNVADARFHHNLLDNLSDDGIFLTATAANDGSMPGGNLLIYQNRLSRALTMFAFGAGHGRQTRTDAGVMTGRGVWIFRNVLDFRRPVYYFQPRGPEEPQELTAAGRCVGDHGSPIWEPMFVYHNTIIAREPAFRSHYAHGWGGQARQTVRAVLNNLIVQVQRPLGAVVPEGPYALLIDGNLHWSYSDGGDTPAFQSEVGRGLSKLTTRLEAFPRRLAYPDDPDASGPHPLEDLLALSDVKPTAAYRALHDRCAEPRFQRFTGDWSQSCDYRLGSDSPARGAGVPLPPRWPDPLRATDSRDLGALPGDSAGWRIGVHGRFQVQEQDPQELRGGAP